MRILNKTVDMDAFFKEIRQGSLLMLDFDGTLAPFKKERSQAIPYPGVIERLKALRDLKNARIVIVSGRSLKDLEILIGVSGLELWGSHGLERKLVDGKKMAMPIEEALLERLSEGLKICLDYVDAKQCEVKPYAIALHWRDVEIDQKLILKIQQAWEKICITHRLEIFPFEGGIELRPNYRNKKDVVYDLLREVPSPISIAYLGDDNTDEEAFEALGTHGLKILVRKQMRATLADLHLIPPKDLLLFLDQWRDAYVANQSL